MRPNLAIRLSVAEQERMMGLPHFVRALYIFALRPYMDLRTGLAGDATRISYGILAKDLYVDPHPGESDSGSPTTSRVKRAVQRLIAVGLLENRTRGERERLVFFFPEADTDLCARKKPGPNPDQSANHIPDQRKPSVYAASRPEAGPQPGPAKSNKPDVYPESGITTNTDVFVDGAQARNAPKNGTRRSHGTRLPDDWRPSDELVTWTQGEAPGLDIDREADKFRDYWHSQPGTKGRKANWDATWRNWIRNSIEKRGTHATRRHTSQSAQDRIAAGQRERDARNRANEERDGRDARRVLEVIPGSRY